MDTMDAFNGLVGRASLKRQMGKILRTLKEGDLYRAMGGTPPKGLLFLGRPGTGKTSFAKAFMEASGRTSFLVRPGDPRFDDLDALFAEAKEKLREAVHQKKQHELERRQKLKAKRKRDLTIFVIGLLVMLTILIYAFPSPFMIVFSTLLLFTFFFLGIAYQRMIMQLLVVAVACVIITSLFFTAVYSL